ncbi:unnamed protein product [Rhizoctonia solani]|uniref:HMG box domain-containing protein n=1 Tax=Rhizoctonia solani TaxID=456999 RepID=A0A8H3DR30_9AGAM|nr:unnamed protein product [Rhizoctonia solani]
MPAMSKSSRPSRVLISPNPSHDTPTFRSPLKHASSDYHTESTYATCHDAFPRDSPRFSTEQREPSNQLCYPDSDSRLPSGGSVAQARASLDLNDSPTSSHENLNLVQTGVAGPIRVAKSHSRRQPPGHIPRPRNAFILYRSWYVRQGFLSDVENDHREISRIVGKIWKQMSPEEQAPWKAMAEEEKAEHARMYPNYKYSPNSRRDAAAASPTSRSAPARSSRSRKTKASETHVKRSDAVAGAFVSGSRKLSLVVGVRKIDEQIKTEESEASTQSQALSLAYPASPSGRSSVEPNSPTSPVYCGAPQVDFASVANHKTGLDVPGTLPAMSYDPIGDFSLAACSTLTAEFNPDSVRLLPPEQYYRSETFFKTALRPYYDVDAGLGTSMTCDDMTDFSSFKFSTDLGLHSQTSNTSAMPNHQPIASEPELSPFDRIALEGTPAGHPGATSFGTPAWGNLLTGSSTSTSANSSSVSESFSNFSWGQYQNCSTAEKEYSVSSVSGGDAKSRDYGLFSEWCSPDSPIGTDGSEASVLTPTSLSSGMSPPPLSLAYPSPTYPPKHSALLYHSWETSYEDMDAYERALGDIKAEIDDHRFF